MNTTPAPSKEWLAVALACAAAFAATPALAEGPVTTTPYRPSVSTPAALSAPGWLEIETGIQSGRVDDLVRRRSLPYTLKLAFSADWGIRVGGDLRVSQSVGGNPDLSGPGDTSLVLKRRFGVDDDSAFGLELGVKLPTARTGLGTGHTDVGVAGIYSLDFASNWHADVNYAITRIGGTGSGVGKLQSAWAAGLSLNLNDKWGLGTEISGTRQRGNERTQLALAAASYAVTRGLTWDLGISKGLNSASGGWSAFTGVTFLAVRLF